MAVNVAVLIHGMIPDIHAVDSAAAFKEFWQKVEAQDPGIRTFFPPDNLVFVSWGHQPPGSDRDHLRQDQRLTIAQSNIAGRVDYDSVRVSPGPNNVLMNGFIDRDFGIPMLRGILTNLRENIVQFGLSDVVYYCSEQGEKEVRNVVYSQVLECLERFRTQEEEVRLHVFGHSLGVTITHDFLFGLFTDQNPDFLQQGNAVAAERYEFWRERRKEGKLTVGSFTSMASQLPLFMMRKHTLINTFFENRQLDPAAIGIDHGDVKWQIFYDIDDVLGFASRDLYSDPHGRIKQIQVDTGDSESAHNRYLENKTVIRETARLLTANAR